MMLLGMGIAITVPYFVLFATKELGMTTNQFGILLALAVSQFTVNSIVARFSDTHSINRKVLIISALMMGAISFSIYFIFIIFGCLLLYTLFSRVIRSAMPQLYASARESINVSSSRNNAKFANTVLRSMFSFGFLFGPLIGAYLIQFMGYLWTFGGTVFILLFTLILQIFFYKDLNLSTKSKLVVRPILRRLRLTCLRIKHYLFHL